MSLRSRARAGLVIALACASAAIPRSAAHAGIGALYDTFVCKPIPDIPGLFDFETNFIGLVQCPRLCADAGQVCKRAVQDAASCQLQFASDWIAVDSRLDCSGFTGALLRDCKAGWALDKKFWQSVIKSEASFAVFGNGGCLTKAEQCRSQCSGTGD